jgi:hypothetical protein
VSPAVDAVVAAVVSGLLADPYGLTQTALLGVAAMTVLLRGCDPSG